jgi:hypothetical protein
MFTKESLYINAIKYDTQLKLDYKKLNDNEIIEANNSVFLVDDEILSHDIAHKLNASQNEINNSYISTLLISDTTRLVPKSISSKLKDCEIAELNSEFDIAVLKTTLFETKNYFDKTGVDYIYSAFHILNLHLEQNICKNQLLIFLFNNKAFVLILGNNASIVFNKTVDLPTFESIKKTHFYDDDITGQKLYDEIYYLELNEIIHNMLNEFYTKSKDVFVEKIVILYALKQLSNEQIEQLSEELLLPIDYHPINIDEEIFELSKDKHLKKSFIKPRKKAKKRNFNNLFIFVFFLAAFFGIYKLYINMEQTKKEEKQEIRKVVELPDHVNINDKIDKRIKSIFKRIPYDIVLKSLKLEEDSLEINATLLADDTFIKSVKPSLDDMYTQIDIKVEDNKKNMLFGKITAKKALELENIVYKTYSDKYITDEFMPISRVSEQLKILFPDDTIVKFNSSKNEDITKFFYSVSMLVETPAEFFNTIEMLNNELYSINIMYPVIMTKNEDGFLEIEFKLVFNQPK